MTNAPRSTRHRALISAFALCAALSFGAARAAPAPDLWAFWAESDDTSTQPIAHSAWQNLLDSYLVSTPDGRTLFNYDAVTRSDRNALNGYITYLTKTDPRTLARSEQLAYWINLYNALTVQVVLDNPRKKSIRDMGGGWFSSGPWDEELVTIAGQPVTLNDIEHRILRPIWQDHHIHYAVNCASVSCPNLQPKAYTPANTRELMELGEDQYLTHARGMRFDPSGELHLSSLFDWYQEDFGNSRAALLDYLASERQSLAERLTGYEGPIHYHYDWGLNDVAGSGLQGR